MWIKPLNGLPDRRQSEMQSLAPVSATYSLKRSTFALVLKKLNCNIISHGLKMWNCRIA